MRTSKNRNHLITKSSVFIVLFAIIASIILIVAHAANPNVSVEPEGSVVTSPANIISDASASGGRAIKFQKAGAGNCAGVTPPSGYSTLGFCDDFSANGLDLTKWQPNWLGGSNTAISKPPNSGMTDCEDPANVSQPGDGYLYLKLEQRSCTSSSGNNYTSASGYVSTHNSYHPQYGYFEARMNVQGTSSNCYNWSGVWANGMENSGVSWPVFLEDDIMECLGNGGAGSGNPAATIHAGPSANSDTWKHTIGHISDIGGTKSGWHIFGSSIQPGPLSLGCSGTTPDPMTVTTYYDGTKLGSYDVCAKATGQFLNLQNDIGNNGGEPHEPSTVQFDWARVWQ